MTIFNPCGYGCLTINQSVSLCNEIKYDYSYSFVWIFVIAFLFELLSRIIFNTNFIKGNRSIIIIKSLKLASLLLNIFGVFWFFFMVGR